MNKNYSKLAKCPFYIDRIDGTQSGGKILCFEGMDHAIKTTTEYRGNAYIAQQFDLFCCNNYRMCPLYRMILDVRYDGDDGGENG